MKKLAFAVLAISLSATALAAPAKTQKTAAKKTTSTFLCEKGGNLTVRQIAQNKVTLHVDKIGKTITLTQAVSGSGVRYATAKGFYGKATDLHMKGKTAQMTFIDPYGNKVNESCDRK